MAFAESHWMIRRIIGSPATGIAGLARISVSGLRRVPSPAVSTSACCTGRSDPLVKKHVTHRKPTLAALLAEQPTIRIEQVVARRTAERFGHVGDALRTTFDLDKHANRRLVHGDDDVLHCELFTVFLVPEPHSKPEMFEDAEEQRAVTHNRLQFFPDFDGGRLDRTFECDEAFAGFHS